MFTVPEVLPLVQCYYAEHPVGGSLHIVLDDGNVEDNHVDFCIDWAVDHDDAPGTVLGWILRQMSKTQRGKLYKTHDRYKPPDDNWKERL